MENGGGTKMFARSFGMIPRTTKTLGPAPQPGHAGSSSVGLGTGSENILDTGHN